MILTWSLCWVSVPRLPLGKLEKSDHVRLDEEIMIKDLEQEKVYKYLNADESSGIQHATMKQS